MQHAHCCVSCESCNFLEGWALVPDSTLLRWLPPGAGILTHFDADCEHQAELTINSWVPAISTSQINQTQPCPCQESKLTAVGAHPLESVCEPQAPPYQRLAWCPAFTLPFPSKNSCTVCN